MSMSGNLEDLSNDEIRIKLLEYGFQNLPVTQTTRKVLIKKLRNSMETQKVKSRRETFAVIKSSDEDDIPEISKTKREKTPNRRATVAVTEKSKKPSVSSSSNGSGGIAPIETPKKSSSRRSSRATPSKDPKPIVSSTANIPILQEDSDSDVIEVPIRRSKSKTPISMGKSDTVRTSYKSTIETVDENFGSGKTSNSFDEFFQPAMLRKPSPIPQTSTNSVSRRKTLTTTSLNYDDIAPEIKFTTPKNLKKTSITTSYNPSGTYNFDEEPLALDESNTPYLSNFAKRLSTLKAEPLDGGVKQFKSLQYADEFENKPSTSYNYRYTQSYNQQPPLQSTKRGVVKEMARTYESLDQKYNVRKYAYIALFIMIIVAIYVFIFM